MPQPASAPAWLVRLLRSNDPAEQKRGLQALCDALEQRFPVDFTTDPFVRAVVPRLKLSQDPMVRRWLYKLAGLLSGTPAWATWLHGQVMGGETDPENVSWAVGALSVHVSHSELRHAVEIGGHDYVGTSLALSPRYFATGPPLTDNAIEAILTNDDYLQHRWLSLLHGKDRRTVPLAPIIELNRHPEPSVAEYSLWSVYRDPAGRLQDLAIRQDEIEIVPPNVRRWYYRVLTKDPANMAWPNGDVIKFAIDYDPDPAAREGFALGLAFYPGPNLAKELVGWYEREAHPLVKGALLRHFDAFKLYDAEYAALVDAEHRRSAKSTEPVRTCFVEPLPGNGGIGAMDHLRIASEEDCLISLLAVDTVGFSLLYDVDQVRVFRDLLAELATIEQIRAAPPEGLVHLLTGDGFIVAFLEPERRLDPLRVGTELQRVASELWRYELRCGVHAGPARLLVLADGTRQLISNAINWVTRVAGVAAPNELLVSAEYYSLYVRAALNEFPGYKFDEFEGRTKHQESVSTLRVVRPQ